jgi:hypothetical protein
MHNAAIVMLLFGGSAGLLGCSRRAAEQPPVHARITAKYRVLDERMSPDFVKCAEKRKEFLQAGPYACSFKLSGLEFVIERKFVLDSSGHLLEYWPYHAEGPEIYTQQDLARNPSLRREEGLDDFHITFIGTKAIADGLDTVEITRVFPKERLLFTRRSAQDSLNGRRLIYQYQ